MFMKKLQVVEIIVYKSAIWVIFWSKNGGHDINRLSRRVKKYKSDDADGLAWPVTSHSS